MIVMMMTDSYVGDPLYDDDEWYEDDEDRVLSVTSITGR